MEANSCTSTSLPSLILLLSQLCPLLRLKNIWEKELGLTLDEIWWSDVLRRINACICAHMSLMQFKVVFRIHYTRARLKKLFPDTDEFCIRCSQSPADHTHTWCPLIAMFGVSLVVGRFTSYQADVIAFAALIAKRQILLR